MPLEDFFNSLDKEAQFEAWKSSTKQKLSNLYHNIPNTDSNAEYTAFISSTIQILEKGIKDKENFIKRLKKCNSFYKKFGDT